MSPGPETILNQVQQGAQACTEGISGMTLPGPTGFRSSEKDFLDCDIIINEGSCTEQEGLL